MACSSPDTASGLASTGIVLAAKRMKNGGILSSWVSVRGYPFLCEFAVKES